MLPPDEARERASSAKTSSSRTLPAAEFDESDQTGVVFRINCEESEASSPPMEHLLLVRSVYERLLLEDREGRKGSRDLTP